MKRRPILIVILMLSLAALTYTQIFPNKDLFVKNIAEKLIKDGNTEIAAGLLNVFFVSNKSETLLKTMLLYTSEEPEASLVNSLKDVNCSDKNNIPLVYYAASKGYNKLVESFAKAGANLNHTQAGKSLLLLTVERQDLRAANLLLKNGTNPNLISDKGQPIIYYLMQENHYDFVKILSKYGAKLSYLSPAHKTLFDLAFQQKDVEMINFLKKKGVRQYSTYTSKSGSKLISLLKSSFAKYHIDELKTLLQEREYPYVLDGNGVSPFTIAVYSNNLHAVNKLLESGIDPNYPYGLPLQAAIKNNDLLMVLKLLDAGADPNRREYPVSQTALHAAVCGDLNIVMALVESGAILNAGGYNKITPLKLAKKCPESGSAEYLSSIGGSLEPDETWIDELTPLSRAAARGNNTRVIKLLEEGGSSNDEDIFNNTALHYAARTGKIETLSLLLRHGAKINFNGYSYYSPLLYAAWYGQMESCKYLLGKGADLNSRGSAGKTILHLAARSNNVDLLKFLLDKGLDINAGRGKYNGTPLHQAAAYDARDTAELLIENGADINALDKYKSSPLHEAVLNSSLEVTQLLLEKGVNIAIKEFQSYTAEDYSRGNRNSRAGIQVYRLIQKYSGKDIQASFDCNIIKTVMEYMICGDNELAKKDLFLFTKISEIMNSINDPLQKQTVQDEQQLWLRNRYDRCGFDPDFFPQKKTVYTIFRCLKRIYANRIAEISR